MTDIAPSRPLKCDVLLRGGHVMDPQTGRNEITDVAVSGRTITGVGGGEFDADLIVDVSGLVVTAGFIDMHSHAQNIPSFRLQAFDGVTTALELEAGTGHLHNALELAMEEGRPINYGYSASWAHARMSVLDEAAPKSGFLDLTTSLGNTGWQRPANSKEQAKITARLEEEIAAGALGIGVLVGYAPQTGRREYFNVARMAASYKLPTFTHSRYKSPEDPNSALEGAAEVVAAAAGTGAHMHLCHINSTSLRAIDEVGEMIDTARGEGVKVTTEAYPYGAGMTAVGAPFLHPDNLSRLGIGPSNLALVSTGERPKDAKRLLEIRRTTPGALVVIHYLDEQRQSDIEVLQRALMLPNTAIASDALPFTTPEGLIVEGDGPIPDEAVTHPRSVGTFARFLRTMVRETGKLSLLEALRRCSLLPAQMLSHASPAMAFKGSIQPGFDADIIAFDFNAISDRATYLLPSQRSVGMTHVLVGGEFIIADGTMVSDAFPGRALVGRTK